jgi:DNA repair exonuclease SbcCD ATPase subunit
MSANENRQAESWVEAIPGIENALAQALDAVQKREEALASLGPVPDASWLERLSESRRLIAMLETRSDAAAPVLAEMDAELRRGEEELRGYIQALGELRQKLEEWAGRAVG